MPTRHANWYLYDQDSRLDQGCSESPDDGEPWQDRRHDEVHLQRRRPKVINSTSWNHKEWRSRQEQLVGDNGTAQCAADHDWRQDSDTPKHQAHLRIRDEDRLHHKDFWVEHVRSEDADDVERWHDRRHDEARLQRRRPKRVAAIEERGDGRASTRLIGSIRLHMLHDGFPLVPILIGRGGEHTRGIAEATGCKVRIRGRGSGHKEPNGREASTPLTLVVTADADNRRSFEGALVQCIELLRKVERRYRAHCREARREAWSEAFSLVLKGARYEPVVAHLKQVFGDALPSFGS